MEILQLPVGQMQTNCYLLIDEHTRETTIIDPGSEADFITEEILKNKAKPVRIIFTHGHFDHILGAFELVLNFSIPCYLHQKDLSIYQKTRSSSQYWQEKNDSPTPPIITKLNFFTPDHIFRIGEQLLTVIETPGHTPGSVSLSTDGHLFTGDTLFSDSIGSTSHRYSDPKMIHDSLQLISSYPHHTIIHPGHGPESTLKEALELTAMGY